VLNEEVLEMHSKAYKQYFVNKKDGVVEENTWILR